LWKEDPERQKKRSRPDDRDMNRHPQSLRPMSPPVDTNNSFPCHYFGRSNRSRGRQGALSVSRSLQPRYLT
jgi:hypothetical protein